MEGQHGEPVQPSGQPAGEEDRALLVAGAFFVGKGAQFEPCLARDLHLGAQAQQRTGIRRLHGLDAPEVDRIADARGRAIAAAAAGRVVRKEQTAVRKAAMRLASDAERFREWAAEFFGAPGEYEAEQMASPREVADRYASERCRELERVGVRAFEGADGIIGELAALALSCAEEE